LYSEFDKYPKMAKKKGGKNKLANMSEEDRIRHMQHLAEIEAEFKRLPGIKLYPNF
jgi:hypothetical protein